MIDSLFSVVVRPTISPAASLGIDLPTHEIRALLDFGLNEAMRELGVTDRQIDEIEPYGGSGSEYRGWLYQVSKIAEQIVVGFALVPEGMRRKSVDAERIADELIFLTRSVSFSMRYDGRQFPAALANGVEALSSLLPSFREHVTREIKQRRQ